MVVVGVGVGHVAEVSMSIGRMSTDEDSIGEGDIHDMDMGGADVSVGVDGMASMGVGSSITDYAQCSGGESRRYITQSCWSLHPVCTQVAR